MTTIKLVVRVCFGPGSRVRTSTSSLNMVLLHYPLAPLRVSHQIPPNTGVVCARVPQLAKRSGGGGGGRGRNGGRGSAGSAPAHGSLPVMTDRSLSISSGGGEDGGKGRKQKSDRDRERDRGGVGGGGGVAGDAAVKAPPGKKSRKGTAGWRGKRGGRMQMDAHRAETAVRLADFALILCQNYGAVIWSCTYDAPPRKERLCHSLDVGSWLFVENSIDCSAAVDGRYGR